jgi:RimJ/RimL family protein N-acetyltransferase
VNNTFPTPLRSARLLLRVLQLGDAAALCGYRSLPEVARFQSWSSFKLDDATRLIEEQSGRGPNLPGTWFQFAIVEAATDTIVGDCGLHCLLEQPEQMELGISLSPVHQSEAMPRKSCSACSISSLAPWQSTGSSP